MRCATLILASITALVGVLPLRAEADVITVDSAGDVTVLGGSNVTDAGLSVFNTSHVRAGLGSAITGLPLEIVSPGFKHEGVSFAPHAESHLIPAYDAAADFAVTEELTGQDLDGLTLLPGVYFLSSSAQPTHRVSVLPPSSAALGLGLLVFAWIVGRRFVRVGADKRYAPGRDLPD